MKVIKPVKSSARRPFAMTMLAVLVLGYASNSACADESTINELLAAVVKIRAEIPQDARSAELLGAQREGSGVVIESGDLILTIGYIILEAAKIEVSNADGKVVSATIVGTDYDAGFGLLRTSEPLSVKPMPLGESSVLKARERALVVGEGKPDAVQPVFVTSRREFTGYWEYLLEDAIFTAPPYPQFAGAALVSPQGQLLGIGSLFVRDALPDDRAFPGNMFVPIDSLKPVLPELIAHGRPATQPRPWLGIFTEEYRGRVFVTSVIPEGPADKAGIKPDNLILGVAGKAVDTQASFYRAVWGQGSAGADISLNLMQGIESRTVVIRSGDRSSYFNAPPARAVPHDSQKTQAAPRIFRTVSDW